MSFQDVLAAEIKDGARTDETTATEHSGPSLDSDHSPFSLNYDLSSFNVEDGEIDRALSVLVAVTNLL